MGLGQLPHQEDDEANQRRQAQDDDFFGGEPIQLFALVQHELQGTDPHHQQCQPHAVDGQLAARGFAVAVNPPGDARRQQAHRHVDVKNPRPRHVVRDPAAQQRADHGGHQRRHAPERQRQADFLARVTRHQQGL